MRITITNDADALRALEARQEEGLDFLFNCYYTRLVYFTLSYIPEDGAAEEIVSDAFLKLWQLAGQGPSIGNIKALLYKICRNGAIDHLRWQKGYQARVVEFDRRGDSTENPVDEKLLEAETYHQLHQNLSRLPEKCREVFCQFYFEQRPIKEIARQLGISENTVKSQKQRAVRILRGMVGFIIWWQLLLAIAY